VAKARKEADEQQETVVQTPAGEERVVTYHLRLRSTPDPHAARAMICQQAMSIPERDVWVNDANHLMFQLCVEVTLEEGGNAYKAGAVVRVRKQTGLEIRTQREGYERRMMMLAEAESRQLRILLQREEAERQRAYKDGVKKAHTIEMTQAVAKQCTINANHISYCQRQRLESRHAILNTLLTFVDGFIPLLRRLLLLKQLEDGTTTLTLNPEMVGRPLGISSLMIPHDIAEERLKQLGVGLCIDRRRRVEVRYRNGTHAATEEQMQWFSYGSEVSPFGQSMRYCLRNDGILVGGADPFALLGYQQVVSLGGSRCIVGICYYHGLGLIEVLVYEPYKSRTHRMYLSPHSLPMIADTIVPIKTSVSKVQKLQKVLTGLAFKVSNDPHSYYISYWLW